ncbi:MAG TPA: hypothetical protein VK879_21750 [Candidatus Sulfomarinibacteraceae bacterium]|nr:hypothetical protein [Candidatus Sulfomarinibacteraceae bacterium]
MRRVLGIVMVAIGLSGIILSVAGLIAGHRFVDAIGAGLQTNLTLTVESLETVKETLILTKATVRQLDQGLSAVQETADNVSVAIDDTRPLLQQASIVTTQEIPQSIEAFQEAMPALREVASTIDDTMRTLDSFNVERSILGIPLSFDLGVEYNPEVPFDESVDQIGESLEGVPEQLRSLEEHIDLTGRNLQAISRNVSDIARNLGAINTIITDVEPLLDDYIAIITELSDSARQSRLMLQRQMDQVKIAVTIVMVWFGLTQVAPLYLGWELLTGRRDGNDVKPITQDEEEPDAS